MKSSKKCESLSGLSLTFLTDTLVSGDGSASTSQVDPNMWGVAKPGFKYLLLSGNCW